jgi:glycosyltransferase involved in cell wall biosynthesis
MPWYKKLLGVGGGNAESALIATGMFQPEWYVSRYVHKMQPGETPATHFIRTGDADGYFPNPYFDPAWYRKKAKITAKYKHTSLEHYSRHGWLNGIAPSRQFHTQLYLKAYPEVKNAGMPALRYHLEYGPREGKTALHSRLAKDKLANGALCKDLIHDMVVIAASRLFDEEWYTSHYLDLRNRFSEGLLHFVQHGARENRQPNPIFQTHWYRSEYLSDMPDKNPLVHYITKGVAQQRNPAPNFISKKYIEHKSAETFAKGQDPLHHFLQNGFRQGKYWPQPDAKKEDNLAIQAKPALKKLPVPAQLRGMLDFEQKPLAPRSKDFNPLQMQLHWIIPDFAPGGGGHMTIFRMVNYLERLGHKQTIWIHGAGPNRTDTNGSDDIQKYFQFFSGDVLLLDERFETAEGDALIATDCWTVWPALNAEKFHRRFYFVQDFEPSFHPMGAQYLAAEQTYRQDLDCICASPWLAKKMKEDYGRWASHFWLAADTGLYHPAATAPKNKVPRVAFYARHFTARRAVELGFLALEELSNRGVKFEVDFFGAALDVNHTEFDFVDHGVADPEHLAEIFQKADIGVVFSATNYSLVPQEMMACGLPIVELKGDSTEGIFPSDTVTLAEPHPRQIADALAKLIEEPDLRRQQANAARIWVEGFCWEASAKLVEKALQSRLTDFVPATLPAPKVAAAVPKAAVVVPTYNAGAQFEAVLKACVEQAAPWPFEILVIDSGSTDGTLDIVKKYPSVKLHEIDGKTFNHGGTRNLGVELTTGEYIAFLTHDALPADNRWLYKMVTSLERHPEAAGAFGKHLPYPDASPFTKRDLGNHFDNFRQHPLCVDKNTEKRRFEKKDQGWRQFLHFYSDNNSCMRRSVWEKIPYRPVKFGEDQVWAEDIIRAGYAKLYSPRAQVYHSHDFGPEETFERSKTESAFFKHFFGYRLIKNSETMQEILKNVNADDSRWAAENNVSEATLKTRFKENEARLKGQLAGAEADTAGVFD